MVNAFLLALGIALTALGLTMAGMPAHAEAPADVLAVGVPRPLQLAVDGRVLLVLSPGLRGDSAAEIFRVPLDGEAPLDLTGQPRIRIPFAPDGGTTLGSLAFDPGSETLYLGEENGKRLWRLGGDGHLVLYATGLRRLQGGSTLAFDATGRLLVVDYADRSDERATPGLEQLREDDYRGPLLFRIELDPGFALPRRVANLLPLWPRAVRGRASGGHLPYLVAAAPLPHHEVLLLSSTGELHRLSSDGAFSAFARLPRGQYNRINMVAGTDGTVYVSGGFFSGQIFRVAPDGTVTTVASGLADPEGIALDARGILYVAESGQHRILKIRTP
jgi:NHL repeat-containing protein